MEKKLNKNQVGLAVGGLYALWHMFWSLLVFAGLAYPVITWILRLHFLSNPFGINEFSFGTAAMLIIVTFIIGYILGWVFAYLWNWLHHGTSA